MRRDGNAPVINTERPPSTTTEALCTTSGLHGALIASAALALGTAGRSGALLSAGIYITGVAVMILIVLATGLFEPRRSVYVALAALVWGALVVLVLLCINASTWAALMAMGMTQSALGVACYLDVCALARSAASSRA